MTPGSPAPPLLVGLAFGLAWSSPSSAQDVFDTPPVEQAYLLPGAPDLGRSVVGDFTGDLLADVLTLGGLQPLLLYGPGEFKWSSSTPFLATDVAVLPGLGAGGEDGVIYADATGVHRALFVNETQWVSTSLGYSAFASAERVIAADLDLDGEQDVVAIDSSASSILVVKGIEDGVHTPQAAIVLPTGTAYDVAAMDWSGGDELEIVVAHDVGLIVLDHLGTLVGVEPLTYRDCLLYPFREGSAQRLLLVYSTIDGGIESHLRVYSPGAFEGPLHLGPNVVTAAAIGDADGDGRDDVVVVHEGDLTPTLYFNQVGSPTFTAAASESVDHLAYVTGVTDNEAAPVLADLDNDGDPDLLFGTTTYETFYYLENATVTDTDKTLVIDTNQPITWEYTSDAILVAQLDPASPAAGLGSMNAIQMLTYYVPSGTWLLDPNPLATRIEEVSGRLPSELEFPVDYVWSGPSEPDFEVTYFVFYRLVRVQGAGEVVDAGPYVAVAFTPWNTGIFELNVQFTLSEIPFYPSERQGANPGTTTPPEEIPEYGDQPATDP